MSGRVKKDPYFRYCSAVSGVDAVRTDKDSGDMGNSRKEAMRKYVEDSPAYKVAGVVNA